jgi:drug/metabolite transporter (DMT)-like permease
VTNGILLALIAYASFSCNDAVVKSLGGQFTVFEIGFFSTLFAGLFLLFTRPNGERWRDFWHTKRPWAVQARAWSGIASALSVYAFTTIPLAEAYALIFLAPLCVTILSTLILKEKVGPWRWLAVVAGFAGVMLVVRPGFRELHLGHLAAFGVAFLAAASVILMRSLAAGEMRTTMLGVLIGQLDRADALLADPLGGDPGRAVLPGISRFPVACRPRRRRRLRAFDDGARGGEARHGALESVFADEALIRPHRLRDSRQR